MTHYEKQPEIFLVSYILNYRYCVQPHCICLYNLITYHQIPHHYNHCNQHEVLQYHHKYFYVNFIMIIMIIVIINKSLIITILINIKSCGITMKPLDIKFLIITIIIMINIMKSCRITMKLSGIQFFSSLLLSLQSS